MRRVVANTASDQMTIMVESSRSFLFTEYARSGCGVFKDQGTDPRAWDALPDKFSAYPNIQEILRQVKKDKQEGVAAKITNRFKDIMVKKEELSAKRNEVNEQKKVERFGTFMDAHNKKLKLE